MLRAPSRARALVQRIVGWALPEAWPRLTGRGANTNICSHTRRMRQLGRFWLTPAFRDLHLAEAGQVPAGLRAERRAAVAPDAEVSR
jgi:hypothetical protein